MDKLELWERKERLKSRVVNALQFAGAIALLLVMLFVRACEYSECVQDKKEQGCSRTGANIACTLED